MQRDASTVAHVEAYLAALPPASRTAMDALRAAIRSAVPEATETISYQMPAFRHVGRVLVSYGAFKGPREPVSHEHGGDPSTRSRAR